MPRQKGFVFTKESKEKMSRSAKGRKLTQEHKEKISKAHKGKPAPNRKYWLGKKRSLETIEKMRLGKLGQHHSEETKKKISETNKRIGKRPPYVKGETHHFFGKKLPWMTRENHPLWIKDRSKLKSQKRNDGAYKDWRKQVWLRDKFTCRIADNNCDGRIEAHHILGYTEYPELRYQTNNGITLCRAHHPRKRAEEKRLILTFQELVSMSVSKE